MGIKHASKAKHTFVLEQNLKDEEDDFFKQGGRGSLRQFEVEEIDSGVNEKLRVGS